jgi:hypothetical protein
VTAGLRFYKSTFIGNGKPNLYLDAALFEDYFSAYTFGSGVIIPIRKHIGLTTEFQYQKGLSPEKLNDFEFTSIILGIVVLL